MKLLYQTAEWHGLAKLRLHTESSLALLDELTKEFGELMQKFQELTCAKYSTVELPKEMAARKRCQNRHETSKSTATIAITNTTTIVGPTTECKSILWYHTHRKLITITVSNGYYIPNNGRT